MSLLRCKLVLTRIFVHLGLGNMSALRKACKRIHAVYWDNYETILRATRMIEWVVTETAAPHLLQKLYVQDLCGSMFYCWWGTNQSVLYVVYKNYIVQLEWLWQHDDEMRIWLSSKCLDGQDLPFNFGVDVGHVVKQLKKCAPIERYVETKHKSHWTLQKKWREWQRW